MTVGHLTSPAGFSSLTPTVSAPNAHDAVFQVSGRQFSVVFG